MAAYPNDRGTVARLAYAKRVGMDVMYAENVGRYYRTWTLMPDDPEQGVEQEHKLPDFYTLQGLQRWAENHRFAIIYVP